MLGLGFGFSVSNCKVLRSDPKVIAMRFLDHTCPTPAENLACDEALLDEAESNDGGECLRFWESRIRFIVLGFSNPFRTETFPDACAASGIPILRRCSGGGTVLQGPGCLNYNLILSIENHPELESVTSTNRFVMSRNAAILQPLVDRLITVDGITDLSLEGRKFSGNAQRRRRRFALFHGTFLIDFDLAQIDQFLPLPARQPNYRQNRSHAKFLTSIPIARRILKQALQEGWNATLPSGPVPDERIQELVESRYGQPAWNLKV
jgi:lipoate---protein ligase